MTKFYGCDFEASPDCVEVSEDYDDFVTLLQGDYGKDGSYLCCKECLPE